LDENNLSQFLGQQNKNSSPSTKEENLSVKNHVSCNNSNQGDPFGEDQQQPIEHIWESVRNKLQLEEETAAADNEGGHSQPNFNY